MESFTLSGQYVAIEEKKIFPAELSIAGGRIAAIRPLEAAPMRYLLPGFVDAHIHIESSMLVPTEFARVAVTHGTVATVSDPHEIANVCGVAGVTYMIGNAAGSPLKFNFGAPSCVPATSFETAGATIDAAGIDALLQRDDIRYLAEMMNFPGVLNGDEQVMAKIAAAQHYGKPVDGHAPGLRGAEARLYAAAGISTDHECVTLDEALDKIAAGMLILIREGSAARNYQALAPLLHSHPRKVMFCSDDKHPDELLKGHINELVVRAVAEGYPVFDVLYAACVLPVQHYGLDVGLLREGDAADLIVVDNLREFTVLETYIDGCKVAENGRSLIAATPVASINHFSISPLVPQAFALPAPEDNVSGVRCRIIDALDGQLITEASEAVLPVAGGYVMTDSTQDVLKIAVVNRYRNAAPAIGFIRNFGLKRGALASSVAHDSHNIVVVGVDDGSICRAVNTIIAHRGGISLDDGTSSEVMPLPVAGLMTDGDAVTAGRLYEELSRKAGTLGTSLAAPFMTLSFMALPVIPYLKMTDKGLFDVGEFAFTTVLH
ncbi:adenine deaminase [Taibaiella koreensis]|uniref:adenine deaminase n=1 Tax=Taibaiella koreensis TaxID=1268548 RepID=UPI0019695330|nr:adenine deaminase [Taibaiella koreensis]